MQFLNRLYGWYGKRVVWGVLGTIILLVIAVIFLQLFYGGNEIETEAETSPTVSVQAVNELGNGTSFDVIGTVAAVNEARLQAEAGGRVTNVSVKLGDVVRAGTVVASIENSSQHASLIQAEGVYESALAAAATSEVGKASAETNLSAARQDAVSAYRSAYIAADAAVRGTADQVFSNPRGQNPGLQIDGFGRAPALSSERVEIEALLEEWSRTLTEISPSTIEGELAEAQADLEQIISFVGEISALVDRQQRVDLSETEKASLQASFLATRNTLAAERSSLQSVRTAIETAEERLLQAEIAAANGQVSAASAQVKQALGTLRQAQAAYEKTLVRSPIAGTVNALYLKEGTYVSSGEPAVVIANNGSLEIATAVGEEESGSISVGDSVMIESSTSGVVTAIAPAIDPATGKVAVKIGVTDEGAFENGSTVRVTFTLESGKKETEEILIPLTSLKITPEGSIVFRVTTENKLEAIPVTLGPVRGDLVRIEEGLSSDTEIVVDARGLKEGEVVETE